MSAFDIDPSRKPWSVVEIDARVELARVLWGDEPPAAIATAPTDTITSVTPARIHARMARNLLRRRCCRAGR